jgi:hypothetical protein
VHLHALWQVTVSANSSILVTENRLARLAPWPLSLPALILRQLPTLPSSPQTLAATHPHLSFSCSALLHAPNNVINPHRPGAPWDNAFPNFLL